MEYGKPQKLPDGRYFLKISGLRHQVNGMTVQDLDPAGTILGVTLTTDIFGLDMTRVTFTDNSVSIDLGGLALGTSASFTLDLQTIPEPTALLPIVAAIGALGWTRRRYARYAAAP